MSKRRLDLKPINLNSGDTLFAKGVNSCGKRTLIANIVRRSIATSDFTLGKIYVFHRTLKGMRRYTELFRDMLDKVEFHQYSVQQTENGITEISSQVMATINMKVKDPTLTNILIYDNRYFGGLRNLFIKSPLMNLSKRTGMYADGSRSDIAIYSSTTFLNSHSNFYTYICCSTMMKKMKNGTNVWRRRRVDQLIRTIMRSAGFNCYGRTSLLRHMYKINRSADQYTYVCRKVVVNNDIGSGINVFCYNTGSYESIVAGPIIMIETKADPTEVPVLTIEI